MIDYKNMEDSNSNQENYDITEIDEAKLWEFMMDDTSYNPTPSFRKYIDSHSNIEELPF